MFDLPVLTQQEYGQPEAEEQRPLELVVGHVAGGQQAGQHAGPAAGQHRVITAPHAAQTLDTVH